MSNVCVCCVCCGGSARHKTNNHLARAAPPSPRKGTHSPALTSTLVMNSPRWGAIVMSRPRPDSLPIRRAPSALRLRLQGAGSGKHPAARTPRRRAGRTQSQAAAVFASASWGHPRCGGPSAPVAVGGLHTGDALAVIEDVDLGDPAGAVLCVAAGRAGGVKQRGVCASLTKTLLSRGAAAAAHSCSPVPVVGMLCAPYLGAARPLTGVVNEVAALGAGKVSEAGLGGAGEPRHRRADH